MRNLRTTYGLSALLTLAVACGSTGGSAAGGSTVASAASNQATAALAAKLGINPILVDLALSKAKSMLGGGAGAAPDKGNAALAGVQAAAAQAQSQGQPLTDDQKGGLLEGLKNML